MFKNKIDKYLRRTGYNRVSIRLPVASVSTGHMGVSSWVAMLLNSVI